MVTPLCVITDDYHGENDTVILASSRKLYFFSNSTNYSEISTGFYYFLPTLKRLLFHGGNFCLIFFFPFSFYDILFQVF